MRFVANRRLFFRFSLRAVLIAFAASGLCLGLKGRSVQRQRAAIAWVRKHGGEVYYDFEWEQSTGPILDAPLPGPAWLRSLVGVDFLARPIAVSMIRSEVADISPVSAFTALESLELDFAQNVADVRPLARLTNLKSVFLGGTGVVDISPIQNLRSLRDINLNFTRVSDLSPVAKLQSLESLAAHGTSVRDIDCLVNLKRMRSLSLSGTQIDDASPLARLSLLYKLDLSFTPLSDVEPLESLSGLRQLDIRGTFVGDQSVERLELALPLAKIKSDARRRRE